VVFSPLSGAAGVVGTCLHIVCDWYINNGLMSMELFTRFALQDAMSHVSGIEVRHFGDAPQE
jgi:hypothetical protein